MSDLRELRDRAAKLRRLAAETTRPETREILIQMAHSCERHLRGELEATIFRKPPDERTGDDLLR